ncbi:MAG TPA: DUF2182 domain-containing protein [Gemmatimonadaceae bacterium]|nr:DUF2182 domain-containing protein [Gemmatimonadaceae bacterium]
MPNVLMPGMPQSGATWLFAALCSIGMWTAMMAAMMLPSLLPALWRYRRAAARAGAARPVWLAVLVGGGYCAVWAAAGLLVCPLGVALAAAGRGRPLPASLLGGVVVLLAGAFQFTSWKTRHLAAARHAPVLGGQPTSAAASWRHGVRLGLHCCRSCANLTTVLAVIGLMDVRAMAALTAAVTVERLVPSGRGGARAVGTAVVVAGVVLIAHAARPG